MNEDNQNQGMNHTGMNQNADSQNNGTGSYNNNSNQSAQNGNAQNDQGTYTNGNRTGTNQETSSGQNYNFKTPEYGRNDHYGENNHSYGGTNNGQGANNYGGANNGQSTNNYGSANNGQNANNYGGMNNGQSGNNYGGAGNGQNGNYYGGQNYGQGRPPKKHSEFAKELGHFAAKAAIAAVIGVAALAVAGTIALNATNKNVYIVDKNKQVTVGNSGNDSSNGFPFGSFGFGGPGSSDGNNGSGSNGGNSKGGSDNNGDGDESQQPQSDDDGPKLGVKVESMPDKLAKAGYPEGVLIAEVTKGGAADKAGLKTGDVITAFNGTVVKSADELVEQVQNVKAGDTVKVNYKRMENGTFKAYDADVTFSEQSDSSSTEDKNAESDSSDTQSQDSSEGTESN